MNGTSACYADIIDVKEVKKIAPNAYRNFMRVLKQQKVDIEDFAKQYQDDDVQNDKVLAAWKNFVEQFELHSKVGQVAVNNKDKVWKEAGLILSIGFHDVDECGDEYDEVNGVFFSVEGMYQLTPAGNKFNNVITRKFYTQWG